MTPRTGMLVVCAVTAFGGVGMIVVGLVRPDVGQPIGALGFCAIALAGVGALNVRGGGK